MNRKMTPCNISVVGMGYVGLCTAVVFASKGHKVIASETNSEKVEMINRGILPFHEPNLQEMLLNVIESENFKCTSSTIDAVSDTDITFITVGTPSRPNGCIDLQYVKSASRSIGKALHKKDTYHLVVVKSTVLPGTTEKIVKAILEKYSGKRCGVDFGLCMSPEFLREGSALYDTLNPDRIVIGEFDKKSGDILEALYRDFYAERTPPIIRTSLVNAELIKYASNAFLATKISFINTIANICEKIPGADVTVVAKGIGVDKRIGPLFLNAGVGYGGSCLPKDTRALIAYSKSLGYNPELLQAVENINQSQPYRVTELCKEFLGDLKGKKVAILGLSFKPNTDDMREAPSITIINNLLNEGAEITVYDPVAIPNAKTIFRNKINYASSVLKCLKDTDCCILVTEWEEFRKLKPEDFARNMRQPILIDGRRIYNPKDFRQKLKFTSIGLGE